MRLSQIIAKSCRRPHFQVPLFAALLVSAGVSVADQSTKVRDDQNQMQQRSSVDASQRDNKNPQGMKNRQSATGSQGAGQENSPSFSQVDTNQDNKLVWTEIYAIYDDELRDANWDEASINRNYDADRNNALNDQEYLLFITDLRATPSSKQNAQIRNSPQKQQERQQAAEQAQQQSQQGQSGGMASTADQNQQQTKQARQNQADAQKQEQRSAQAQSNGQPQQSVDSGPVSVLTVTTITSIPVESLKNMEVINNRGEDIGEVEHVLTEEDGTISGLVVGVGGFWDIGDKDVQVDADQLRISGNYIVWDTALEEDQLDNLPEYSGDELSGAYQ